MELSSPLKTTVKTTLQTTIAKRIAKLIGTGLQFARSSVYAAEGLPLVWIDQLTNEKHETPPKEYLAATLKEAKKLFAKDLENIEKGYYPWTVLIADSPKQHLRTLSMLGFDLINIIKRKIQHENAEFSDEAQQYLHEMPGYFRRNFHFQSDGYLSEKSAERYDHQVEILFRGSAAAMRRMTIPPLFEGLKGKLQPRILEVGCGPGSTTRWIAQSMPEAYLTAVDLSWPYLKQAQKNLSGSPRINFVQADSAKLPFKDEEFDAWTSIYVFHELPIEERKKVIEEAHRVLKKDGLLVFADSIQNHDNQELKWGLERFPRDFHEPFYKNYLQTPMEKILTQSGFEVLSSTPYLLTKVIVAKKL